MEEAYYIGIDIGGTFTDVIAYESLSKNVRILKIPSTPLSPERAVIDALKSLGIAPENIALITHASTVATNALLTKVGLAKSALITNRGFRDVLEIGRQRRSEIYDLNYKRPPPLIMRKLRFAISGRISADGEEIEPLNFDEMKRLRARLYKEKVDSVAISFINSYRNNSQEFKVKDYLKDVTEYIFTSHEVDPEFREYERTSTTTVNAVLAPLISKYLRNLEGDLISIGIKSPFYMMGSNGGLNTITNASKMPISVIESGPSAGVIASSFISNMLNLKRVITFDMGGTTAKAGILIDGKPDISSEFEAAGRTHSGRSIKGSGYAVRFPFIDLAEVSAGGGSIAWIDEGGSLRVGPLSAGAEPGPAAYNRGGKNPTITDANILLGRIDPEYLLGGNMKIFKELSEIAIKQNIAERMGIDVNSAADGIISVANNMMGKALSIVSIERGRDTRDFIMMAYGGAGPLHACDLANELEIKSIIVPPNPGLFSAFGLLTVDVVRSISKSVVGKTLEEAKELLATLEDETISLLKKEGFVNVNAEKMLDIHYVGQSYEITVQYSDGVDPYELFRKKHYEIYGYDSNDPIEIVNAKVVAKAPVPKIVMKEALSEIKTPDVKWRRVYLGNEFTEVPVLKRESIARDSKGKGPAIIEGYDSTIVVNRGWTWNTDKYLNIVMRRD
jgi:N-methylhydantoinase A